MKQKLLASMCALLLLAGTLPSANALNGDAQFYADTLETLQLVETDNAGLSSPVTRGQAVTWLVQLAGAENTVNSKSWHVQFMDVPAENKPAVGYATTQGWVSGVTPVSFQPDRSVTANAWLTMLLRMLGYSDRNGDFTIQDAPAFALRIGLVSREYTGVLTRGDVFETMYNALTFSYKDGSETVAERLISNGSCSPSTMNALGILRQELTARQIADRYLSAVFCMDLYKSEKRVEKEKPDSNASGFFITADGLAVTNYHSIDGMIHATATLTNGEVYPIEKVIYYDAGIDIAVVRVSRTSLDGKTTSAFATLELAGTGELRVGDVAYTLGNPLGLGLAVSDGIISNVARQVDRYVLPCVMSTADISQGSSGGALMNVYGQVIAVTSGAYVNGNGMYLAVPVDPVLTADLTGEGLTLKEVAEKKA